MKRFAVAGALMAAGLAGVVIADEKTLKELEGSYTVLAMEKGGKSPPEDAVKAIKISIKGDELIILVPDEKESKEKKAKIKIDVSKTPNTIDITPIDGDAKGKTFPGIFKAEKGEVTLVFTEKGDRPKELKSDGEAMLVRMKKEEKK